MDDTAQNSPSEAQPAQPQAPQTKTPHGILDKTMAEILQESPQAQSLIKKAMHISDEDFQKMLATTQQNDLMHMKVRDLFKNGVVEQAVQQQPGASEQPVQSQGEVITITTQDPQDQQPEQANKAPEKKNSLMDKVKKIFG